MLWQKLIQTNAPAATWIIRWLVGLVFFLEGIKKFLFVAQWGRDASQESGFQRRNFSDHSSGALKFSVVFCCSSDCSHASHRLR